MPTIEQNKLTWDGTYDWDEAGEKWSAAWGGSSMQWYGTILPRLHAHFPANTILEIAPGYGRWTQFLKGMCAKLIVVDLSEKSIKACRERFADDSHLTYYVNDGKSLGMIADDTIDLAFSFDSLVHAEDIVISSYISQLSRKLKRNGVAFIHHSNLGEYSHYNGVYSQLQKIPKLPGLLSRMGILDNIRAQWRAQSMSARKMQHYAEENGLTCISQELVTWSTKRVLIDCISTIVRNDAVKVRGNRVLRNYSFMKEAKYLSELSELYALGPKK
jgi:Methyltransferase domain.